MCVRGISRVNPNSIDVPTVPIKDVVWGIPEGPVGVKAGPPE